MNDVGRPLAMIVGGKYEKKVISVSDKFSKDDETLIKEFKQLTIPNDADPRHDQGTRDSIYDGTQRQRQEHIHEKIPRAVEEEE